MIADAVDLVQDLVGNHVSVDPMRPAVANCLCGWYSRLIVRAFDSQTVDHIGSELL